MNPILSSIISTLILTLINGIFAGAELAFVSIDKREMQEDAQAGNAKAQRVLDLLQDSDSFLSTIQIAITLAGFLNSASAANSLTAPIARALPWMPEAVITLLITLLISYITLVLGELVPKQVAMQVPNQYSKSISGLIHITNKIFQPIVKLLNVSTTGVLKLLPIDFDTQQPEYTRDEIRYILGQAQEEASIDTDEFNMLRNVLGLDETRARDIMTHRLEVVMFDVDDYASHEAMLEDLLNSPYSRIPLYQGDKDNIVGILHTKLVAKEANAGDDFNFNEALLKPLEVSEHIFIDDLLEAFKNSHTHLAILRDEYGGFEGIITLEDIIEEIVGNIEDETDQFIEEATGETFNTEFKSTMVGEDTK